MSGVTWHDILPTFLTAIVMLAVGALTWWNGRQKNQIDSSSMLVTNAMNLVTGLQNEIGRLQKINEQQQSLLEQLQKENNSLRLTVARMDVRIRELEGKYDAVVPSESE